MYFLQIGFISETTKESCAKTCRILLTHVTSKYPNLLSNVLDIVKNNMGKIGSHVLYLYEDLPLSIWVPSEEDIKIISHFLLLYTADIDENRLARMILSRLNWHLVNPGKLFLPHNMHCQVALLVLQAAEKEPACTVWAWQTISRLRLHINDQGFTHFANVKDIEQYDVINRGELSVFFCSLFLLIHYAKSI